MFEALTDRLQGAFRSLTGQGKISEENVREAIREVRTALLEADVQLGYLRRCTMRAPATERDKENSIPGDSLHTDLLRTPKLLPNAAAGQAHCVRLSRHGEFHHGRRKTF